MAEGERRSVVDERRYAIITKESISMMAESGGHDDIDDTIAGILGEDVSYRLREITQKSAQFMRHSRRKCLHTVDFNKACRFSDIQPVHGHGSSDPPAPFHHIKTDIGESIHFTDDAEQNLASAAVNDYMPKQLGDTTIKVHWLAVEGVQKTTQNPQGNKIELSTALVKYFDKITQAVLGLDSEMMKTALSDVRTNANISPLLPHFVSFVANGVKVVSYDLRQLSQLLYLIQSLVYNSSLFLEAQPFLAQLIQSIEYCLLQPLPVNGTTSSDQWSVKDYAARLLSHVISIWGNSVNHLERFTEKTLRETLYDHNKPYSAHYGAIMGLLYLGSENIERVVLPHLGIYWPFLMSGLNKSSPQTSQLQHSASMVYGALLLSVEHILRKYIKQFKDQHLPDKSKEINESASCDLQPLKVKGQGHTSSSGFMSMFHKSPVTFYIEMMEYFGDSLTLKIPEILELKRDVFTPSEKEVKSFLTDTESQKSGEDVLAELEEQVKQEEQEKKLRHKEIYHKVKKELDFKERTMRQRREQENRQADRRQQLQIAQQRQLISAAGDSDVEVDVEGDNDKSDNSFNSEKSEEDLTADMSVAVKSSIGEPGQGIKLTFTKKPKLTQFSGESPFSDLGDCREKEFKSRKRKHGSLSPDFDHSNYETGPSSFTHLGIYSSEGEGSSDSGTGRKSLTIKFKKRDNV